MEKINFKKKFGQNFIYDTNLLRAIVSDAGITSEDNVLEIGVGIGTLTKELCLKANKVVSYEIDTDLKPQIEKTLDKITNSLVVYKDFMDADNDEISTHLGNNIKVVANLPYYITTPIIFKLLSNNNIKSITIMVQKEVAQRICAKFNTEDYGILTIMIQSVANVSIKRIVNRNMFTPMPNVDSAIVNIQIDKNKYNIIDYKHFTTVIQSAFAHRRKMLLSNIKTGMGYKQDFLENVFSICKIDKSVRGEALDIQTFVNLSNTIIREQKNEKTTT